MIAQRIESQIPKFPANIKPFSHCQLKSALNDPFPLYKRLKKPDVQNKNLRLMNGNIPFFCSGAAEILTLNGI